MNNAFTFVLLLVTIVLFARIVRGYLSHKQHNGRSDKEIGDALARIDELEERVRVLERIVTESRYDLKQEIDGL